MFDFKVLAIDVDSLLLLENINMESAKNLLIYFSIIDIGRKQKIYPETMNKQINNITSRMDKAIYENEIKFTVTDQHAFRDPVTNYVHYNYYVMETTIKDVIRWARKAKIHVPNEFYSKVFPSEQTEIDNDLVNIEEGLTFQVEDTELTGKERQELGRLRVERDKWDSSIKVAVTAGIICVTKIPEGTNLTRKSFDQLLREAGHKGLEDTTINKIWKALPPEVKSKGGRPKKD